MKRVLIFTLIALLTLGSAACQSKLENSQNQTSQEKTNSSSSGKSQDSLSNAEQQQESKNQESDQLEEKPNPNSSKLEGKMITIYFGDSEAMGLNGEERKIADVSPEALINEILKGPQDTNNSKTIPDGTKLLGVEVKNNTAYVNFSKEFKDNHWGGSSGESITIFSIVNTLVLNPNSDIERVQLLLEGQTMESLSGHMDTTTPLEPNLDMVNMK